jgi:hypothetical protein
MIRQDTSQRQDYYDDGRTSQDTTKQRSPPEGLRFDEVENVSDLVVEEDLSEADEAKMLSVKGSRRLKWTNPSLMSSSLFWGVLAWLSSEFVPSTSDERRLKGQTRTEGMVQKGCVVFVLALALALSCLAFHLFLQLSCLALPCLVLSC